ncbi:MAG: HAD family hydrolase [Desulfovibrio sp.]|uniref:HAD family hydrolase n=1 Tax=Desulfovibrio sp. 7SRBS1 TaxID=3378064 RepID=UPI003B3E8572
MIEFCGKTIRAVIFDAEGVVVDTETVWDQVQHAFLARRGLTYNRAKMKPLMAGRPGLEAMAVLKQHMGLQDDTTAMLAERDEIFSDLLGRTVCFIDGFSLFFQNLEQTGLPTAMATSMSRAMLDRADDALGIRSLFNDRIVTGDDIARGKPAPDIYLKAAELAATPPENCLAVEDTPIGLQAALSAGMATLGLGTTFDVAHLSELAHAVADGYAEAADLLFTDHTTTRKKR